MGSGGGGGRINGRMVVSGGGWLRHRPTALVFLLKQIGLCVFSFLNRAASVGGRPGREAGDVAATTTTCSPRHSCFLQRGDPGAAAREVGYVHGGLSTMRGCRGMGNPSRQHGPQVGGSEGGGSESGRRREAAAAAAAGGFGKDGGALGWREGEVGWGRQRHGMGARWAAAAAPAVGHWRRLCAVQCNSLSHLEKGCHPDALRCSNTPAFFRGANQERS
ncbi:hypothetical protein PLESTB_001750300 [Pleodorina starrii]|uniref:Uncharacterized protein n=1 Tax=Pleodorina starrii TaxID=330485 RepID=A0A9W6C083_9CHLO|nr:hypothetical protein PLESTB_001750300 [Pleodorina starrii]GLC67536.1 hypothetical protein PLESTF_000568100 [Pleodorina starrii]